MIEETGLAAGVLNHPANGVAWLANKIAPYGEQLQRRRRRARPARSRGRRGAQAGDSFHADYGPLGSIAFRFV